MDRLCLSISGPKRFATIGNFTTSSNGFDAISGIRIGETLSPGASDLAHKNGNQQVLFTALDREVLEKLRGADLDQLKPLDALNLLAELKKQIS